LRFDRVRGLSQAGACLLDDLERRDRGLVVAQAEAHDTLGISAVLDTDERVIGEVEASLGPRCSPLFSRRCHQDS
jgi:hypothetical protein